MSGAVSTPQDCAFDALAGGTFEDPFAFLGPHSSTADRRPAMVVRTFQPSASRVDLIAADQVVPMTRVRREGLFEATVAEDRQPHEFQYRLRIHEGDRVRETTD